MPICLSTAALQRLLELAEARQRRRHPERLGHLLDHPQAVFLLAQNEFDQLIADREEGQPIAAFRGRRDPSGISRRIGQCEFRPACFGGIDQQHVVTPALGHEQPAIRRGRDAARPGQRTASFRAAPRTRSSCHTVPLLPRSSDRAAIVRAGARGTVGDDQRVGVEESRPSGN